MAKKSRGPTMGFIKNAIADMEAPALREIIRALAVHSVENRALIATWTGSANPAGELLEASKKKINAQFFVRGRPRMTGGCDFRLCRRLVKEYRDATTGMDTPSGFDARGTIELGLHFISTCSRFLTQLYFDGREPYDGMMAVAVDLAGIAPLDPAAAEEALPTLRSLADMADNLGCGLGDEMLGLVDVFEEAAAKRR